ncbi:hypothetical protein RI129_002592 [Pyrocoelia pectoralis]|uniref:Uncharacterized protein n=1 Tax=Pyrocoelia pectoralis TaxID=417401 RepID=A0AAN7VGB3_9COLE
MDVNKKCKEINVNIIQRVLLTPLTCASIVNEIIKCLLYQKSQIPYPYSWIKNVVTKKRINPSDAKSTHLQVERHYRTVATAYDSLEKIMDSITTQFKTGGSNIKQILVVFGSTLYTAREMYTINISGLVSGHIEENHLYANGKQQYKILRDIFFSDEWINAMNAPMLPTNMYVVMQKFVSKLEEELTFESIREYTKPPLVKNVYVNLSYKDDGNHNCCNDLLIFQDLNIIECPLNSTESNDATNLSEKSTEQVQWMQSKAFVKGFKECFINGISATELW